MNTLDSVATVKKLFAFYASEHNSALPHLAFTGQTPEEMYFGTGGNVPDELAAAKARARAARLEANRVLVCEGCPIVRSGPTEAAAEA